MLFPSNFCFFLAQGFLVPAEAKPQDNQLGGLRYTVLVASFENHSNWHGQIALGPKLGAVLTSVLHDSQRFIVLGENDLRELSLGEQGLASSGRAASGNNTPATGRLATAQLLVRGVITHVQHDSASDVGGWNFGNVRVGAGRKKSEVTATFYMVDSSTGLVVAGKRVEADSNSSGMRIRKQKHGQSGDYEMKRKDNLMKALTKAAEEAVEWMAEQVEGFKWKGQILEVQGNRVIINRGTREGVSPGMRLSVGILQTLTDPKTGEVVRESLESEVATLEVETVDQKSSDCLILTGDPRKVRKNPTVMRSAAP